MSQSNRPIDEGTNRSGETSNPSTDGTRGDGGGFSSSSFVQMQNQYTPPVGYQSGGGFQPLNYGGSPYSGGGDVTASLQIAHLQRQYADSERLRLSLQDQLRTQAVELEATKRENAFLKSQARSAEQEHTIALERMRIAESELQRKLAVLSNENHTLKAELERSLFSQSRATTPTKSATTNVDKEKDDESSDSEVESSSVTALREELQTALSSARLAEMRVTSLTSQVTQLRESLDRMKELEQETAVKCVQYVDSCAQLVSECRAAMAEVPVAVRDHHCKCAEVLEEHGTSTIKVQPLNDNVTEDAKQSQQTQQSDASLLGMRRKLVYLQSSLQRLKIFTGPVRQQVNQSMRELRGHIRASVEQDKTVQNEDAPQKSESKEGDEDLKKRLEELQQRYDVLHLRHTALKLSREPTTSSVPVTATEGGAVDETASKELQAVREELATLKAQHAQAIASHQSEVSDQEVSLGRMRVQLSGQEQMVASLKSELRALQQQKAENNPSAVQNEELQAQVRGLQEQVRRLQEQQDDSESSSDDGEDSDSDEEHQKAIDDLRVRLQAAQERLKESQSALATAKASLQESQSSLRENLVTLRHKCAEVEQLAAEKALLEGQSDETDRLAEKLAAREAELEQSASQLVAQDRQVAQLQNKLAVAAQEHTTEVEALKTRLASAATKEAQLTRQLKTVQVFEGKTPSERELVARHKALFQSHSALMDKQESLLTDYRDSLRANEQLKQKLADSARILRGEGGGDDRHSALQLLREELKSAADDALALQQTLRARTEELERCEQQLVACKVERDAAIGERTALEGRVEALTQSTEKWVQRCQQYQAVCTQLLHASDLVGTKYEGKTWEKLVGEEEAKRSGAPQKLLKPKTEFGFAFDEARDSTSKEAQGVLLGKDDEGKTGSGKVALGDSGMEVSGSSTVSKKVRWYQNCLNVRDAEFRRLKTKFGQLRRAHDSMARLKSVTKAQAVLQSVQGKLRDERERSMEMLDKCTKLEVEVGSLRAQLAADNQRNTKLKAEIAQLHQQARENADGAAERAKKLQKQTDEISSKRDAVFQENCELADRIRSLEVALQAEKDQAAAKEADVELRLSQKHLNYHQQELDRSRLKYLEGKLEAQTNKLKEVMQASQELEQDSEKHRLQFRTANARLKQSALQQLRWIPLVREIAESCKNIKETCANPAEDNVDQKRDENTQYSSDSKQNLDAIRNAEIIDDDEHKMLVDAQNTITDGLESGVFQLPLALQKVQSNNKTLREARQSLETAQQESAELLSKQSDLTFQLREKQSTVQGLESQVADLKAKIDQLGVAQTRADERYQREMQTLRTEQQKRVNSLRDDHAHTLQNLKKSHAKALEVAERKQMKASNDALLSHNAQMKKLRLKIAHLDSRVDAHAKDAQTWKDTAHKLKLSSETLQGERRGVDEALETAQEQVKHLRTDIMKLRKTCSNYRKANVQLQKQVDSVRDGAQRTKAREYRSSPASTNNIVDEIVSARGFGSHTAARSQARRNNRRSRSQPRRSRDGPRSDGPAASRSPAEAPERQGGRALLDAVVDRNSATRDRSWSTDSTAGSYTEQQASPGSGTAVSMERYRQMLKDYNNLRVDYETLRESSQALSALVEGKSNVTDKALPADASFSEMQGMYANLQKRYATQRESLQRYEKENAGLKEQIVSIEETYARMSASYSATGAELADMTARFKAQQAECASETARCTQSQTRLLVVENQLKQCVKRGRVLTEQYNSMAEEYEALWQYSKRMCALVKHLASDDSDDDQSDHDDSKQGEGNSSRFDFTEMPACVQQLPKFDAHVSSAQAREKRAEPAPEQKPTEGRNPSTLSPGSPTSDSERVDEQVYLRQRVTELERMMEGMHQLYVANLQSSVRKAINEAKIRDQPANAAPTSPQSGSDDREDVGSDGHEHSDQGAEHAADGSPSAEDVAGDGGSSVEVDIENNQEMAEVLELHQKQTAALETQIKELTEQIDTLQGLNSEQAGTIGSLTEQCEQLQEREAQLQQSLSQQTVSETVSQLRAQISEMTDANRQLQADAADLRAKIQQQQSTINSMGRASDEARDLHIMREYDLEQQIASLKAVQSTIPMITKGIDQDAGDAQSEPPEEDSESKTAPPTAENSEDAVNVSKQVSSITSEHAGDVMQMMDSVERIYRAVYAVMYTLQSMRIDVTQGGDEAGAEKKAGLSQGTPCRAFSVVGSYVPRARPAVFTTWAGTQAVASKLDPGVESRSNSSQVVRRHRYLCCGRDVQLSVSLSDVQSLLPKPGRGLSPAPLDVVCVLWEHTVVEASDFEAHSQWRVVGWSEWKLDSKNPQFNKPFVLAACTHGRRVLQDAGKGCVCCPGRFYPARKRTVRRFGPRKSPLPDINPNTVSINDISDRAVCSCAHVCHADNGQKHRKNERDAGILPFDRELKLEVYDLRFWSTDPLQAVAVKPAFQADQPAAEDSDEAEVDSKEVDVLRIPPNAGANRASSSLRATDDSAYHVQVHTAQFSRVMGQLTRQLQAVWPPAAPLSADCRHPVGDVPPSLPAADVLGAVEFNLRDVLGSGILAKCLRQRARGGDQTEESDSFGTDFDSQSNDLRSLENRCVLPVVANGEESKVSAQLSVRVGPQGVYQQLPTPLKFMTRQHSTSQPAAVKSVYPWKFSTRDWERQNPLPSRVNTRPQQSSDSQDLGSSDDSWDNERTAYPVNAVHFKERPVAVSHPERIPPANGVVCQPGVVDSMPCEFRVSAPPLSLMRGALCGGINIKARPDRLLHKSLTDVPRFARYVARMSAMLHPFLLYTATLLRILGMSLHQGAAKQRRLNSRLAASDLKRREAMDDKDAVGAELEKEQQKSQQLQEALNDTERRYASVYATCQALVSTLNDSAESDSPTSVNALDSAEEDQNSDDTHNDDRSVSVLLDAVETAKLQHTNVAVECERLAENLKVSRAQCDDLMRSNAELKQYSSRLSRELAQQKESREFAEYQCTKAETALQSFQGQIRASHSWMRTYVNELQTRLQASTVKMAEIQQWLLQQKGDLPGAKVGDEELSEPVDGGEDGDLGAGDGASDEKGSQPSSPAGDSREDGDNGNGQDYMGLLTFPVDKSALRTMVRNSKVHLEDLTSLLHILRDSWHGDRRFLSKMMAEHAVTVKKMCNFQVKASVYRGLLRKWMAREHFLLAIRSELKIAAEDARDVKSSEDQDSAKAASSAEKEVSSPSEGEGEGAGVFASEGDLSEVSDHLDKSASPDPELVPFLESLMPTLKKAQGIVSVKQDQTDQLARTQSDLDKRTYKLRNLQQEMQRVISCINSFETQYAVNAQAIRSVVPSDFEPITDEKEGAEHVSYDSGVDALADNVEKTLRKYATLLETTQKQYADAQRELKKYQSLYSGLTPKTSELQSDLRDNHYKLQVQSQWNTVISKQWGSLLRIMLQLYRQRLNIESDYLQRKQELGVQLCSTLQESVAECTRLDQMLWQPVVQRVLGRETAATGVVDETRKLHAAFSLSFSVSTSRLPELQDGDAFCAAVLLKSGAESAPGARIRWENIALSETHVVQDSRAALDSQALNGADPKLQLDFRRVMLLGVRVDGSDDENELASIAETGVTNSRDVVRVVLYRRRAGRTEHDDSSEQSSIVFGDWVKQLHVQNAASLCVGFVDVTVADLCTLLKGTSSSQQLHSFEANMVCPAVSSDDTEEGSDVEQKLQLLRPSTLSVCGAVFEPSAAAAPVVSENKQEVALEENEDYSRFKRSLAMSRQSVQQHFRDITEDWQRALSRAREASNEDVGGDEQEKKPVDMEDALKTSPFRSSYEAFDLSLKHVEESLTQVFGPSDARRDVTARDLQGPELPGVLVAAFAQRAGISGTVPYVICQPFNQPAFAVWEGGSIERFPVSALQRILAAGVRSSQRGSEQLQTFLQHAHLFVESSEQSQSSRIRELRSEHLHAVIDLRNKLRKAQSATVEREEGFRRSADTQREQYERSLHSLEDEVRRSKGRREQEVATLNEKVERLETQLANIQDSHGQAHERLIALQTSTVAHNGHTCEGLKQIRQHLFDIQKYIESIERCCGVEETKSTAPDDEGGASESSSTVDPVLSLIADISDEYGQYKLRLRHCSRLCEQLRNETVASESSKHDLNGELEQLQGSYAEVEGKLREALLQVASLAQKDIENKRAMARLRNLYELVKATRQRSETQQDQVADRLVNMQAEHQASVSSWQRKYEAAVREKAQAHEDVKLWRQRNRDLVAQMETIQRNMNRLQLERETAMSFGPEAQRLQRQLEKSQSEAAVLRSQMAGKTAEFEAWQESIAAARMKELRKIYDAHAEELKTLHDSHRTEVSTLTKRIAVLQEEIDALHLELRQAETRHSSEQLILRDRIEEVSAHRSPSLQRSPLPTSESSSVGRSSGADVSDAVASPGIGSSGGGGEVGAGIFHPLVATPADEPVMIAAPLRNPSSEIVPSSSVLLPSMEGAKRSQSQ